MKKSAKLAAVITLCILFAVIFGAGIYRNSIRITSVEVRLREGKVEHKDKTLLGIVGKKTENPDYNLQIRAGKAGDWIDCGTYSDRNVGKGLIFDVPEMVPFRAAVELRLFDHDRFASDLLDQVPIQRRTMISGNTYAFQINTEKDVQAGFDWFFKTPLGKIIATGIVIAIVLLVLVVAL